MKKILSLILVAGLLATVALTGMATAAGGEVAESSPYYFSTTGTIVSIEDFEGEKGGRRINIEDTNENPATLILTDNTVYPFESEFKVGDVVTGYYLADAPMIRIWPPQYSIAVLVAGMPNNSNVRVDRFYAWEDNTESYLLSKSKALAFRVDENTEIILANGDDFSDGDYIGRRIVVIYDISTRSIPELTTANKLIVLYEDVVPLEQPGFELLQKIDATGWPIVVNGEQIEAPEVFQTDDGFVMVPLRAAAEALGYSVKWDAATLTVTLNDAITIGIDNPNYPNVDAASRDILGAPAPILKDCFTYVPLQFFSNVLELPNALAFEGRIEIIGTQQ